MSSWNNNDNKHLRKIDKKSVSCEEKYEINFLKNKFQVDNNIIDICCEKIPAPHSRDKMEKCIKEQIQQIEKLNKLRRLISL